MSAPRPWGYTGLFAPAEADVGPEDSGLASGVVNTAFMMGGSLGLAILASMASAATLHRLASGVSQMAALNTGYHAAFLGGAGLALLAAGVAAVFLRASKHP